MFGSTTIDLVIGLVFMYLLLGLISSAIVELIASLLDLRAKYLQLGLQSLLKDWVLIEQFRQHPMINSLIINHRFPPYIPARAFALALLGLVQEGEVTTFSDLRRALLTLPVDGATGHLRTALLAMADDAGEDLDRLRHNIEFWYTSTMDRISGLYKRRIQWTIFITTLALTIAANLDTGAIAKYLSRSTFTHDILANRALTRDPDGQFRSMPTPTPSYDPSPNAFTQSTPLPTPVSTRPLSYPSPDFVDKVPETGYRGLDGLTTLPFGWAGRWEGRPSGLWLATILGWLFTAFAASICSLFWFDILNRFIVVRSAIKPREEYVPETGGGSGSPPSARDSSIR